MIDGQCLCGAVRVSVDSAPVHISACHCAMCRRWSGAAMWGFSVPPETVRVAGEVARYRSSRFAERAFCPVCGTQLWIRNDGSDYDLMPGLFDGLAGTPLAREVYADRAAAYVPLAGDHLRRSRAEYESDHPFVEGDAP